MEVSNYDCIKLLSIQLMVRIMKVKKYFRKQQAIVKNGKVEWFNEIEFSTAFADEDDNEWTLFFFDDKFYSTFIRKELIIEKEIKDYYIFCFGL